jgi:hypothetical protein
MNLPEFRLYYDENGKVLFYTCDRPEGNYLVIDADTYFQSRFDIKIIDGKITKLYDKMLIAKLTPSDLGTSCYFDDVSIIYNDEKSKKWSLKTNER